MSSQVLDRKLTSLTAWVTAGLCFMVVFSITVMGALVWGASRQGSQAQELRGVAVETHTALCALKRDLSTRHNQGVDYLRTHPDGITGRGGEIIISSAQLQQSLNSQQSTLDSLDVLDCS